MFLNQPHIQPKPAKIVKHNEVAVCVLLSMLFAIADVMEKKSGEIKMHKEEKIKKDIQENLLVDGQRIGEDVLPTVAHITYLKNK
jgi:hypothetical protein